MMLMRMIVNKQCGRRVRPTRYAPPASNPDLRPFDFETGVRVASKVGNLRSKFGHARPLGSRIIRYVRDGQSDGRTIMDGKKQRLFPPSLRICVEYGRLDDGVESCGINVEYAAATPTVTV